MSAASAKAIIAAVPIACVPLAGCSGVGSSTSPTPEVSVSDSDGSIVVGEGSQLPTSWPKDVPAPKGLPLQSAVVTGRKTVALYLGPGDAVRIGDTLKAELIANDYRPKGTITYGGASVTTFVRESTKVDVAVGQTGTDASITITVERPA